MDIFNGRNSGPSTKQRLELAEQQLNALTNRFIALSEILSEKGILELGEFGQRTDRISNARQGGLTEQDYRKYSEIAEKMYLPPRPGS